jgi:hypothetical protein
LIYSWPVSSPFYIIHVDVWQPGETTSIDGYGTFLGAMDNLTCFVIVAELTNTTSATLATAFMQQVLLKVGMCGLVCPDAGSSFCGHFTKLCETLNIPCNAAAKGNQQVSERRMVLPIRK